MPDNLVPASSHSAKHNSLRVPFAPPHKLPMGVKLNYQEEVLLDLIKESNMLTQVNNDSFTMLVTECGPQTKAILEKLQGQNIISSLTGELIESANAKSGEKAQSYCFTMTRKDFDALGVDVKKCMAR